MRRYYFTFGSSKHMPYEGGWVEIIAKNIRQAANIFKRIYPNPFDDSVLNCADYYSEKAFIKSEMLEENRGKRCHALIIANDIDNEHPQSFRIINLEE